MKVISKVAAILVLFVLLYQFLGPFRKAELYVLYKLYQTGSGLDDAVAEIVKEKSERYKGTVVDMLDNAQEGSFDADGSFLFAELLINDGEIKGKVVELAKTHPEKSIRCFWHDVINNRFERVEVELESDESSLLFEIRDNGSTCV